MILCAFSSYFVNIGGFRHLYYMTPPERLQAIKYSWASTVWCLFTFGTSKSSVSLLILRILGPFAFWRKLILYFVIFSVLVANSLGCIFAFAQCSPPKALWTPGIPAKCWDPQVQVFFSYFLGGMFCYFSVINRFQILSQ